MRQLKINQRITNRNQDSVNLYFQEVNKYEMITVEEEVELTIRIRKGDELALRKMVEANLRFVISVAKQYQNKGLSFQDLINEGNIGLVKAAKKFDETRGFKFISYAVWWIRQSIMQAISEQTRVVRLPLNRLSTMKQISSASSYLEQKFEREPTNEELAEFLDIREELISENDNLKHTQLSFDKPLSTDGESDMSLYDIIQARHVPKPDDLLMQESLQINLARAMEKLSAREAEIMNLTFGLNNYTEHSLQEIAGIMDLSSERIRQLKSTGLLKLKHLISGNKSFHTNI